MPDIMDVIGSIMESQGGGNSTQAQLQNLLAEILAGRMGVSAGDKDNPYLQTQEDRAGELSDRARVLSEEDARSKAVHGVFGNVLENQNAAVGHIIDYFGGRANRKKLAEEAGQAALEKEQAGLLQLLGTGGRGSIGSSVAKKTEKLTPADIAMLESSRSVSDFTQAEIPVLFSMLSEPDKLRQWVRGRTESLTWGLDIKSIMNADPALYNITDQDGSGYTVQSKQNPLLSARVIYGGSGSEGLSVQERKDLVELFADINEGGVGVSGIANSEHFSQILGLMAGDGEAAAQAWQLAQNNMTKSGVAFLAKLIYPDKFGGMSDDEVIEAFSMPTTRTPTRTIFMGPNGTIEYRDGELWGGSLPNGTTFVGLPPSHRSKVYSSNIDLVDQALNGGLSDPDFMHNNSEALISLLGDNEINVENLQALRDEMDSRLVAQSNGSVRPSGEFGGYARSSPGATVGGSRGGDVDPLNRFEGAAAQPPAGSSPVPEGGDKGNAPAAPQETADEGESKSWFNDAVSWFSNKLDIASEWWTPAAKKIAEPIAERWVETAPDESSPGARGPFKDFVNHVTEAAGLTGDQIVGGIQEAEGPWSGIGQAAFGREEDGKVIHEGPAALRKFEDVSSGILGNIFKGMLPGGGGTTFSWDGSPQVEQGGPFDRARGYQIAADALWRGINDDFGQDPKEMESRAIQEAAQFILNNPDTLASWGIDTAEMLDQGRQMLDTPHVGGRRDLSEEEIRQLMYNYRPDEAEKLLIQMGIDPFGLAGTGMFGAGGATGEF